SFCELEGCDVVVSKANHGLWAISNLWPEIKVKAINKLTTYFQRLIEALQAKGYVPGTNLFGYPYDWRQCVSSAAVQRPLTDLIQSVTAQTGHTPVVICHSMGGQVLRAYLAKDPATRVPSIRAFVAVCCPFKGVQGVTSQSLLHGYNLSQPTLLLANRSQKQCQDRSAAAYCLQSLPGDALGEDNYGRIYLRERLVPNMTYQEWVESGEGGRERGKAGRVSGDVTPVDDPSPTRIVDAIEMLSADDTHPASPPKTPSRGITGRLRERLSRRGTANTPSVGGGADPVSVVTEPPSKPEEPVMIPRFKESLLGIVERLTKPHDVGSPSEYVSDQSTLSLSLSAASSCATSTAVTPASVEGVVVPSTEGVSPAGQGHSFSAPTSVESDEACPPPTQDSPEAAALYVAPASPNPVSESASTHTSTPASPSGSTTPSSSSGLMASTVSVSEVLRQLGPEWKYPTSVPLTPEGVEEDKWVCFSFDAPLSEEYLADPERRQFVLPEGERERERQEERGQVVPERETGYQLARCTYPASEEDLLRVASGETSLSGTYHSSLDQLLHYSHNFTREESRLLWGVLPVLRQSLSHALNRSPDSHMLRETAAVCAESHVTGLCSVVRAETKRRRVGGGSAVSSPRAGSTPSSTGDTSRNPSPFCYPLCSPCLTVTPASTKEASGALPVDTTRSSTAATSHVSHIPVLSDVVRLGLKALTADTEGGEGEPRTRHIQTLVDGICGTQEIRRLCGFRNDIWERSVSLGHLLGSPIVREAFEAHPETAFYSITGGRHSTWRDTVYTQPVRRFSDGIYCPQDLFAQKPVHTLCPDGDGTVCTESASGDGLPARERVSLPYGHKEVLDRPEFHSHVLRWLGELDSE
ncbi:lecithin:cholesterol/ phospholipid:diacylglycerol acyltransferase, partial [Kipferlia bialata]